jgi:hypothetical protein
MLADITSAKSITAQVLLNVFHFTKQEKRILRRSDYMFEVIDRNSGKVKKVYHVNTENTNEIWFLVFSETGSFLYEPAYNFVPLSQQEY